MNSRRDSLQKCVVIAKEKSGNTTATGLVNMATGTVTNVVGTLHEQYFYNLI